MSLVDDLIREEIERREEIKALKEASMKGLTWGGEGPTVSAYVDVHNDGGLVIAGEHLTRAEAIDLASWIRAMYGEAPKP